MKRKPEPPQTSLTPIKVGQKIFREWCVEFGAVVDVHMAADLVKRIEAAIIAERAGSTQPNDDHTGGSDERSAMRETTQTPPSSAHTDSNTSPAPVAQALNTRNPRKSQGGT